MTLLTLQELMIPTLGPRRFPSPLQQRGGYFVDEQCRILACSDTRSLQAYLDNATPSPSFEPAGPRESLFFAPENLTAGIVTCGGLCPGQNNVIRAIVLALTYAYGVRRILGFRYGYTGLSTQSNYEPLLLTPEVVDTIHEHGGTLLGSSRGPQNVGDMVDTLQRWNVGMLFTIGGDGTLRGATALGEEIRRRNIPISIIGIPKTIDNDLQWTERCFGFSTAVEEARKVIVAAHAEARGAWNGIGLVKLMGRHSGFIAAHASLANSDVNFCLLPEVPCALEGPEGFLATLEQRLARKHHAVIVVAEGAGQDILQEPAHAAHDLSGNVRLKDIGVFLRDTMTDYFATRSIEVTVKYIDPSYIIRSLPANATDAEYCLLLGQHAVHAAMAGCTEMMVSSWNQHFAHIPLKLVTEKRRQLNPHDMVWQSVLEATGQPARWQ